MSWQVAYNNDFPAAKDGREHQALMAFLRSRVKHVIYVVKENRTYDQVLGDLEAGNGDPSLTLFPEPITPNHHALARRFVTLDSFLDSGGVSGDGWNWTVAARSTDFTEKTVPVNYGSRGLTYDWEGTNRNVNVGLPTVEARQGPATSGTRPSARGSRSGTTASSATSCGTSCRRPTRPSSRWSGTRTRRKPSSSSRPGRPSRRSRIRTSAATT